MQHVGDGAARIALVPGSNMVPQDSNSPSQEQGQLIIAGHSDAVVTPIQEYNTNTYITNDQRMVH